MSNTLYIGNLSYQMTDQELSDIFASYGTIKSANVLRDRMSGRSRGFGFVEFETAESAKKALELNGKEIKGREISVSEAREKPHSR